MVLYTILNEAEVFYSVESCYSAENLKYSYKKVDNCILEGVQYNKDIMLNRIISTNLKDYLNPKYQIGQKLRS